METFGIVIGLFAVYKYIKTQIELKINNNLNHAVTQPCLSGNGIKNL
jgi:uncharacterized protein YneF (UPF0154 family)